MDFDFLEQQQLSAAGQAPQRVDWADQQDPPEGSLANTDLLDLGEDEGAAADAPAAVEQDVVVQRPPNFNIFHGESLPRLLQPETPLQHTPQVKEEAATGQVGAAKKEEEALASNSALPVDSGIGELTMGPTTRNYLNLKILQRQWKEVLLAHQLEQQQRSSNLFGLGVEPGEEKIPARQSLRGASNWTNPSEAVAT